jgi:hypothetical protein
MKTLLIFPCVNGYQRGFIYSHRKGILIIETLSPLTFVLAVSMANIYHDSLSRRLHNNSICSSFSLPTFSFIHFRSPAMMASLAMAESL